MTIMITNVDEAPAFSTGALGSDSVPENSTDSLWHAVRRRLQRPLQPPASPTRRLDPEGLTVIVYSLAGPDASKFEISADPPVLSFASEPDFEAKASADGDNVYEVTVRASAGGDDRRTHGESHRRKR